MFVGPERSSIIAALEHLTSIPELGSMIGTYWVPKCSGIDTISPLRTAQHKAIGFLTMLHIIKSASAPLPVSPVLLWLSLDGEQGVGYDDEFLRSVDIELHIVLDLIKAWDGDVDALRGYDALAGCFIQAGLDVSRLNYPAVHIHRIYELLEFRRRAIAVSLNPSFARNC